VILFLGSDLIEDLVHFIISQTVFSGLLKCGLDTGVCLVSDASLYLASDLEIVLAGELGRYLEMNLFQDLLVDDLVM
jgi:hypothetical protein